MLVPVNNPAEFGIVLDRKPHELPLNAWTAGRNVRFQAGSVGKSLGYSRLYDPPTIVPYWLLNARDPSLNFWVYAGLAKVYATDGTTHFDITRAAGGDYGATANLNWTGCVFNGVSILNNWVDVPQYWALPLSGSTKLAALPNWDAAWRAAALRSYKNYLVALDVTKSGTRYPQVVKWSHPADPGSVPASWDETDPTKDAGEYPLAETAGACVDCVALRDTNIVYKDDSVWGMQFTGGVFVFRFYGILRQTGILSRRCAVEFVDGKHAVFGNGDLFTHDGQNPQSIATGRVKRTLFSQIDSTYYSRSFSVANIRQREVWFCYPETGQAIPNKALVWNFDENTFGFRDLIAAHIEPGVIDPHPTNQTWDSDSQVWDADDSTWDATLYDPAQRRLMEAAPGVTRLLYTDDTEQFDGVNLTAYVERTGIAVPARAGQPPDMSGRKFLRAVWPRITGTIGGVVNVYTGYQDIVDGAVTWMPAQGFTIGTTKHIDCRVPGRLFAVKFESDSNITWQLHGYELDIRAMGRY